MHGDHAASTSSIPSAPSTHLDFIYPGRALLKLSALVLVAVVCALLVVLLCSM